MRPALAAAPSAQDPAAADPGAPIGRVLAVDHGLRRIGVASSDPLGLFARPLTTLDGRRRGHAAAEVARMAAALEAATVVVGLPLLPSGDRGPQADAAAAFAAEIEAELSAIGHGARVVLQDESHTTAAAAARAGAARRAPRAGEDAAAAAQILEEWLAMRETERHAEAARSSSAHVRGEPA